MGGLPTAAVTVPSIYASGAAAFAEDSTNLIKLMLQDKLTLHD